MSPTLFADTDDRIHDSRFPYRPARSDTTALRPAGGSELGTVGCGRVPLLDGGRISKERCSGRTVTAGPVAVASGGRPSFPVTATVAWKTLYPTDRNVPGSGRVGP
jgi:hypothetical protein